jgi:hypothetical protein
MFSMSILLFASLVYPAIAGDPPYKLTTNYPCPQGATAKQFALTAADGVTDQLLGGTRVRCELNGQIVGTESLYANDGKLYGSIQIEKPVPVSDKPSLSGINTIYTDDNPPLHAVEGRLLNGEPFGVWNKNIYSKGKLEERTVMTLGEGGSLRRLERYGPGDALLGELAYVNGTPTMTSYYPSSSGNPADRRVLATGKIALPPGKFDPAAEIVYVGEWTKFDKKLDSHGKPRPIGKNYYNAKGELIAERHYQKNIGECGTAAFYYEDDKTVKAIAPVNKKGNFEGWSVIFAKDGTVKRRIKYKNGKIADSIDYIAGTCKYKSEEIKVDENSCKPRPVKIDDVACQPKKSGLENYRDADTNAQCP